MKPILQKLRPFLFPRHGKITRHLLRWLKIFWIGAAGGYKTWMRLNEPGQTRLTRQAIESNTLSSSPRFCLTIHFRNPNSYHAFEQINSICSQTYQNWVLWLFIDTSLPLDVQQFIHAFEAIDQRIHTVLTPTGMVSIFAKTMVSENAAFVGFIDQNDTLAPFALFEVAKMLAQYPDTDLIYSDEDQLTTNGARANPFFKSAFNIDYLRSHNYINHFLLINKSLGDRLGWFRTGFEKENNYDLIFRSTEQARLIMHIPQVLYHCFQPVGITNKLPENTSTSLRIVEDHLSRCHIPARVEYGLPPGVYRVRYILKESPKISIIIPNRDHFFDLQRCVNSILAISSYQNFEIIIVENNSTNPEIFSLYQNLQDCNERVRVLIFNHQPFNFSEINNFAVSQALGSVIVFLNNDTEIISADWLECMLEYSLRPDVGAVGAKLLFPSTLIQHAGVIINTDGRPVHFFAGYPDDHMGYHYNLQVPHNLSGVTAACMMMRKDVLEQVNGFETDYRLAYGDTDLCLKLRNSGYLIVWTPFSKLIHHESMTRGYDNTNSKLERNSTEQGILQKKWRVLLEKGDPYYNPNLDFNSRDFIIRPVICDDFARVLPGLSQLLINQQKDTGVD